MNFMISEKEGVSSPTYYIIIVSKKSILRTLTDSAINANQCIIITITVASYTLAIAIICMPSFSCC